MADYVKATAEKPEVGSTPMDKTLGEVAISMGSEEVTKPLVDGIVTGSQAMPKRSTVCNEVILGIFRSLAFICSVMHLILGIFAIDAAFTAGYNYLMSTETAVERYGHVALGLLSMVWGLLSALLGGLGVNGIWLGNVELLRITTRGLWCLSSAWVLDGLLEWAIPLPGKVTWNETANNWEQQVQMASGIATVVQGLASAVVVVPRRVGWTLDNVVVLHLVSAVMVHVTKFLLVQSKNTDKNEKKMANTSEK